MTSEPDFGHSGMGRMAKMSCTPFDNAFTRKLECLSGLRHDHALPVLLHIEYDVTLEERGHPVG
jgi:hypothetical protein